MSRSTAFMLPECRKTPFVDRVARCSFTTLAGARLIGQVIKRTSQMTCHEGALECPLKKCLLSSGNAICFSTDQGMFSMMI